MERLFIFIICNLESLFEEFLALRWVQALACRLMFPDFSDSVPLYSDYLLTLYWSPWTHLFITSSRLTVHVST